MPRHQHAHDTSSMCAVCGACESALTTDCPGTPVNADRQLEVYETNLDFTELRGWHLGETKHRTPHFESTKLSPEAPRADPRTVVAPSINWALVDRHAHLQHELTQKAIDWALADRGAADHAAVLTRLEDEIDARLPRKKTLAANSNTEIALCIPDEQTLLGQLEHERIAFRLASARAEKCNEEFHQAARTLVDALEDSQETLQRLRQMRIVRDTPVIGEALASAVRKISRSLIPLPGLDNKPDPAQGYAMEDLDDNEQLAWAALVGRMRCDQCDPSFTCFAEPAKCRKRPRP